MWVIYAICGSLLLSLFTICLKTYNPFQIIDIIKLIPFMIIVNHLLWLAYFKSSSFIYCWLLCIITTGCFNFILSIFLMKEKTNYYNIIGFILLLISGILINKK